MRLLGRKGIHTSCNDGLCVSSRSTYNHDISGATGPRSEYWCRLIVDLDDGQWDIRTRTLEMLFLDDGVTLATRRGPNDMMPARPEI